MEDNYELYILLEDSYVKKMKENDPLNFSENKIFPYDWYNITDYKLKIDILNESLKNNVLIKDTKTYKK